LTAVSTDRAYNQLKDHLIASTGLAFYADRDHLLTDVIAGRLARLQLRDCSVYTEFLKSGDAGSSEMERLVAQLTIGETYFFRDPQQIAAIRDTVLPDILERQRTTRRLRIWSAGCANGAEPYSLAILLARDLALRMAGWQVEIHATDLNRDFLAQAAEGKFRESALRCTSDELRRECFSQDGALWTIHERYKRWISFHHMNLADGQFATPVGAIFDLIVCRNVMIYFAPEASRRLVQHFFHSLEAGGWLVVGAVEHNLDNYTAFRTVRTSGAQVYQKRALALAEEAKAPPAAVAPQNRTPVARAEAPEMALLTIDGMRRLADLGDWPGAAEYGERLLSQDRLNPAIHFYRALVLENLGVTGQSERSLRQAIYLDRNFAMAHYHLGLVLKRDRNLPDAARSFENVLRVLADMPNDAIVTAGSGATVTGLKELAHMQLENRGKP
jgi:chemotaxis protein methyltransferase CheR